MCRPFHCILLFLMLLLYLDLTPPPAQSQDRATVGSTAAESNLPEIYKKWLDEDVRWIITDDERADFKKLSSDQQRDDFVIAFWKGRNPTPGSHQNKFKEQHYQRLAYANTHFAARVPGWKTDRGRMYVMYGPPDRIEHHTGAAGSEKLPLPPATDVRNFDWEAWHYVYIEGLGQDVTFEFMDTCRCGEYHMPNHGVEKDPPEIKWSFPQP